MMRGNQPRRGVAAAAGNATAGKEAEAGREAAAVGRGGSDFADLNALDSRFQ